ncbi:hypothetical protein [Bifidobacterium pseudocatenulatum]|nr:hypothetical protein [Bifidobacterium pseudocatenulatum]
MGLVSLEISDHSGFASVGRSGDGMYLVGMEVMVDVPQYTFAALLWLGRGIVLCVAGLLRIRGIVIGIGILRAGRVVEIICLTLYIATELRPLAGPLRLKLE